MQPVSSIRLPSSPSVSHFSTLTSVSPPHLQQPFITPPPPPLLVSSPFCPLQRPSLARQGWLQTRCSETSQWEAGGGGGYGGAVRPSSRQIWDRVIWYLRLFSQAAACSNSQL